MFFPSAKPAFATLARSSVFLIFFFMVILLSPTAHRAQSTDSTALQLRSLDPPVLLPNGKEFKTWESATPPVYSKTYYVDADYPAASDANPGTSKQPFKTIGRAAQLLVPGERVIVAAGVYRERVDPARGGAGPNRMIAYEAAPGARVVITGSNPFGPVWKRSPLLAAPAGSGPEVKVWQARLDSALFTDGYNPFAIDNVTSAQFAKMPWATSQRTNPVFRLPRGLLFQAGRRLLQVVALAGLLEQDGTYWVDRTRQVVHLRPFGDCAPKEAAFELTLRETVFAPRAYGLGYIRIKGFTIEHAAGPWPFEQVGAISTTRGHHWIIEDNLVREVNGAGIDIGRQMIQPEPPIYGFHIVRRNTVADCGIVGICGLGPGPTKEFGLLVEHNSVLRNGWHDAHRLAECGGIKLHYNNRSLIRRNWVDATLHGPGIWIDANNAFSRVCENVVLRSRGVGGIFLEISREPNLIDRNVVWDATGYGLQETEGRGQTFAHNFIGKCHTGILLKGKTTDRVKAENLGDHHVLNNVIVQCAQPIDVRGKIPSELKGNFIGGAAELDIERKVLVWQPGAPAPACEPPPLLTHDYSGRPLQNRPPVPGPFGEWPQQIQEFSLVH